MTYPRMLYRPGATDMPIWGEQLQTLIINSAQEERDAVCKGWIVDAVKACEKAKRIRVRRERWNRYVVAHWQFWVGTVIAVAGLAASWLR